MPETQKHSLNSRCRQRRGLSTLEVAISAAILGILGAVTLQGVAAMHRSHMDSTDSARADLLARDLMDEILLLDFEGSREARDGDAENRQSFETISDYDGWNADDLLPPQTKDGELLDLGTGWSRRVTVNSLRDDDIKALAIADDTRLKRITVTVSRNGNDLKSVSTIRSLTWKSAQTLE